MAGTGAGRIGPDRKVGETNHRVVPARGEFSLLEFPQGFIDVRLIRNKVEPWMSPHQAILLQCPPKHTGSPDLIDRPLPSNPGYSIGTSIEFTVGACVYGWEQNRRQEFLVQPTRSRV